MDESLIHSWRVGGQCKLSWQCKEHELLCALDWTPYAMVQAIAGYFLLEAQLGPLAARMICV